MTSTKPYATSHRNIGRAHWNRPTQAVAWVLVACLMAGSPRAVDAQEPEGSGEIADDHAQQRVNLGPSRGAVMVVVGAIAAGVVAAIWLVSFAVAKARGPNPLDNVVLQADPPILIFGLVQVNEMAVRRAVITNRSGRPPWKNFPSPTFYFTWWT